MNGTSIVSLPAETSLGNSVCGPKIFALNVDYWVCGRNVAGNPQSETISLSDDHLATQRLRSR